MKQSVNSLLLGMKIVLTKAIQRSRRFIDCGSQQIAEQPHVNCQRLVWGSLFSVLNVLIAYGIQGAVVVWIENSVITAKKKQVSNAYVKCHIVEQECSVWNKRNIMISQLDTLSFVLQWCRPWMYNKWFPAPKLIYKHEKSSLAPWMLIWHPILKLSFS